MGTGNDEHSVNFTSLIYYILFSIFQFPILAKQSRNKNVRIATGLKPLAMTKNRLCEESAGMAPRETKQSRPRLRIFNRFSRRFAARREQAPALLVSVRLSFCPLPSNICPLAFQPLYAKGRTEGTAVRPLLYKVTGEGDPLNPLPCRACSARAGIYSNEMLSVCRPCRPYRPPTRSWKDPLR